MAQHLRANNIPAENLNLGPRHIHPSLQDMEGISCPPRTLGTLLSNTQTQTQTHAYTQLKMRRHFKKCFNKGGVRRPHFFLLFFFFFFLVLKDIVPARQEYRLSPSAHQSPVQLYSVSTLAVQGT